MRIEKLDENRIRIFLNLEDLKEKNIDLHTFMSNSLENQDLFLDMLSQAETQFGFQTKNYKLIIEALASSDGNFVLTITRQKPENPLNKPKLKQPKAKRKSMIANKALSIYMFNTFDEFCEFCNYINGCFLNESLKKLRNASLILYKNNYYLVLNSVKLSSSELKSYSYGISEFASFVRNEALFERKLKEYGSIIINKNAISTCLKYFSNK